MMNYNSQTYLECYHNLNNPETSKKANQLLLELQESNQAWKIAAELLQTPNHIVHGCQLLSKKLNHPLPLNINPQEIVQKLLNLKPIPNIVWLCLAKIFIHTHMQSEQMSGPLAIQAKLQILGQIPFALAQIKTKTLINHSQYKKECFQKNKHLLIDSVNYLSQHQNQSLKDILFQCLQNYVNHKVKINSQQIYLFLLSQQLMDVANILQEILLFQNYSNCLNITVQFLHNNLHNQQIKPLYIAFYRSFSLLQLQQQWLQKVLQTILSFMKEDDSQNGKSILADTFQFWTKLSQDTLKSVNSSIQSQKFSAVFEAFFTMFQIVANKSLLKKIPQVTKLIQSALSIDVDGDDQIGNCGQLSGSLSGSYMNQVNFYRMQIRNYSVDFFVLAMETTRPDKNCHKNVFEQIHSILNLSVEGLELGIFIIDGISDHVNQIQQVYVAQLIKTIFSKQKQFNQYICQKIIILSGKISSIISSKIEMLPYVLQFFSKAISFQGLSSLASESFCQIMEEFKSENQSNNQQFQSKVQLFLNVLYDSLYSSIQNQKVLQNLTKSLIIFIYKFKSSSQYYQQFLQTMKTKISQCPTVVSKCSHLQALAVSQIWLNSQTANNQYLSIYSKFISNFLELLYENCMSAKRKPDYSKAITLINICIKTGGFYQNIEIWLQLIKQLLNKSFSGETIYSISLTPLIAICKFDKINQSHKTKLSRFLNQIYQPLTSTLILSQKIDFNLSKFMLQLHVECIQLHMSSFFHEYSSNSIVIYIKEKIFQAKDFWEYEMYKESLIYLNFLIKSKSENVLEILISMFKTYGKIAQSLWRQLQNILYTCYQMYEMSLLREVIKNVKPQLIDPNPIWEILHTGFKTSDKKTIKNILSCLS